MKRIIKPTLAFMLSALALTATAEKPSNAQQRMANLNALRLIEEYESYSTINNDEAEENFRYIFNNDSARVYNDLPGLAADSLISVDSYVRLLKGVNAKAATIKNIKARSISDGGDVWLLTVDFDKEIKYNTPCRAIISSNEYYGGKDYNMTALVEVDKYTGESHIRSLEGAMNSATPRLMPGFAVARKGSPRDLDVTNNGRRLTFNKFDQAFIEQPYDLQYADEDVNMKVIESGDASCRSIEFAYKPTRFRVHPYYELALGSMYNIDAPAGITATSSGMAMGLDFGFVIPSASKLKIGIFTGAGITTGKIDMTMPELNYSYDAGAEADMDEDTYVRYYELSDFRQQMSLTHVTVPLYLELEYRASKIVKPYAQIGIKAYFDAGSKISAYSGSVYSYGVYPQYQDLRIDEEWLNNFGNSTIGLDDIRDYNPFKSFSADLIAGIGARVNAYGPLSIDLGFFYQPAIIERFETPAAARSLPGANSAVSDAPVSYTVAGGQVSYNPLSSYCKMSSNPLKLKIGITLKF